MPGSDRTVLPDVARQALVVSEMTVDNDKAFLLKMYEEKRRMAGMFEKTLVRCRNEDLRRLIRKIADDEKKQYTGLKDRHDFEIL